MFVNALMNLYVAFEAGNLIFVKSTETGQTISVYLRGVICMHSQGSVLKINFSIGLWVCVIVGY